MRDIEEKQEIRFIDLFGGVGGFRLGLERANHSGRSQSLGENSESKGNILNSARREDKHGSTYFRCIWYNDIDTWATAVYNLNFKENWEPTDIGGVDIGSVPDFELLCAGFPCQSFSIAGRRQGFKDTRGTLFFEIARILEAKRPPLCLLENVRGLLSHDEGLTFQVILESLDELGYDAEWEVLNSKHFGVPQNRERVFVVGHLRGRSRPEVFPLGDCNQIDNQENGKEHPRGKELSSEAVPTIDARYGARRTAGEPYIYDIFNQAERKNGLAGTLKGEGVSKTSLGTALALLENGRMRRLTPIECERLQRFPDNFTKYGRSNGQRIEISDTQRYKMMGNAVTTNVVQAIGERILEVIT